MPFPGPDCLGRGIVLPPAVPVPAPFAECPEIVVDERVLQHPAKAVQALHAAWAERRRVVVRLAVTMERLQQPERTTEAPYALGPGFEFERERLCFLVRANNYRVVQGVPEWWPADLAVKHLGAAPSAEADIVLRDGTHVWCDGGPRGGLPIPVVHAESLAQRRLAITRPADTHVPAPELADDQRRAVLHGSGAARVIAPAGAGKTRVLAARLRHLLEDRGYDAESVTAVAYNKRAAVELVERTEGLGARVKTLHALGYEILRRGGHVRVLQEREVRQLISRLTSVEPQKGRDPLAAWVEALAEVRLALRRPEDVERDRGDAVKGFAAFFPRYREALRQQRACDHDEQIYGALESLLRDEAGCRLALQRQCRHLLVDEFQDLTPAYMLFIRLLAAPGYQVFGVGDDDQVIYGYLGATPDYLIRYSHYFPGAREYALEANYRCHPTVVEAARNVLGRNRRRVAKRIVAAAEPDGAGYKRQQTGGDDMASLVVTTIQSALQKGHNPRHIAVLARVNDSLLPVQLALRDAGVPCHSVVDGTLLQRSGVRAALAWLALATTDGPVPGSLLAEAMTRPSRKIYRATIERVGRAAALADRDLKVLARSLKSWEGDEVSQFVVDLQHLRGLARQGKGTAAILRVLRAQMGLGSEMSTLDESRTDASGSNHFDQLLALEQVAALHPDPTGFEDWLRDELAKPGPRDGVTLSTVHRVKGMEWDIVIVYHATEGLMPHRLSEDVEEERRVFHVAITRGRRLVFVFSESGKGSRFVEEAAVPPQPPLHGGKKKLGARRGD